MTLEAPPKPIQGRRPQTTLAAGLRQTLASIATTGLQRVKGWIAGEGKAPTRDESDWIKYAIDHTIGKPKIAVDVSGKVEGFIRHDHVLMSADALLGKKEQENKEGGLPELPESTLSDAEMTAGVVVDVVGQVVAGEAEEAADNEPTK